MASHANTNENQPPQTRVILAQIMHHVTQHNRDPLSATNAQTLNHCAGTQEQSDYRQLGVSDLFRDSG